MTAPNTTDHEQVQIGIDKHLSWPDFLPYLVTIAVFLPPKFIPHNERLVWTQIWRNVSQYLIENKGTWLLCNYQNVVYNVCFFCYCSGNTQDLRAEEHLLQTPPCRNMGIRVGSMITVLRLFVKHFWGN